ncbi:MAG: InlB B-repeat-containing protein, partial [Clostridia bacterium]|nr:InlB B-repeat-containing protein [Clostridia bacterium]
VSAISASDLGDKTYYAKFTANEDTPYSFKVLVAQYAQSYANNMYFAGALSYVDATAEYAHLFGIDAEKLYGTTDSVIDLTSAVAGLKGVKVNAESVLSGTIAADGSLALVIKLDFDEQALGFNLSDLKIGEYSCNNLTFTLKNHDGVWGLAIDGTIGNGKEIRIQTNYVVADYAKVALTYYEKSPHTSSQIAVISNGAASSYLTLTSATEPSDYVKAQTELISKFPTVATIDEIRLKILAPEGKSTEKHIFIAGIEAIQYTRETVTYSIANGNLMGIATGTKGGAVSELANASHISGYAKVLHYTYEGTIPAINEVGLVFDLGYLKVSEYESIKVTLRSYKNGTGDGTGVKAFINGTVGLKDTFYGGVKVFDAKALAEANNVSVISSIELLYPWVSAESIVYEICVASIELVLKPSCPGCGVIGETHEKCEYCEGYLCVGEHGDCAPVILCPGCNSTEVAHGICEYCENYLCVGNHDECGIVTYNVSLVANGGSVEFELTYYEEGKGATLPLASKAGYTFGGWYENAEFSGEAVSAISASDLGDKTYYAKFTANEDTPYSFKVLVAQYAQSYANNMYFA